MIRHIVMFRLKECNTPEEKKNNIIQLKESIEALKNVIPEIKYIELGYNISTKPSAFDLVLINDFESEETLEIYRHHPEHKKVLVLLKEVVENTSVVDYEY
ncbi:Dabb family protein [Bacteroidota bacterium]